MEFKDRILVCRDCSKEFMFTAIEQDFFTQKGFNDPLCCKECRMTKKNRKENPNLNRQMYKIICAKCGKKAEVSFKPREGRESYCRLCHRLLNL